jgi:hypothetical protein
MTALPCTGREPRHCARPATVAPGRACHREDPPGPPPNRAARSHRRPGAAGRLSAAAEIGVAVGKVSTKDNTGKHFAVTTAGTGANARGWRNRGAVWPGPSAEPAPARPRT